ncbi:MAG TPA: hypothetical protein VK203_23270 [Nostocaceae cyanobacterium]|nr:hypothetical protein [Nostocaceae cyanobacterium]
MNKENLICVSIQGKNIEIDPNLYRAIEIIQAPFLPAKRKKKLLTQGQNLLLARINYDWHIVALWLILLQTDQGKLNPEKSPYSRQDFQDRQTWAKVLNSQLNLCAGVQKFQSTKSLYTTHYERWTACMQEFREWQVKAIIDCPTISGGEPILKTKKIEGIRQFLRELEENSRILLPHREDTTHNYKLLHRSINLSNSKNSYAEREEFRREYWNPFLKAYHAYATDIHNNGNLKSVFPWKEGLAYQGKGRYAPIKIPFEAKLEKILKQQATEN